MFYRLKGQKDVHYYIILFFDLFYLLLNSKLILTEHDQSVADGVWKISIRLSGVDANVC